MKALVIYESLFGNTYEIATAVAEGLRSGYEVEIAATDELSRDAVADVDLLVVGGPTHVHGMSQPVSRQGGAADARKKGLPGAEVALGVREVIAGLRQVEGVRAAAFDTRIDKARWITGSASDAIASALRKKGYRVEQDHGSFLVTETEGPLMGGEMARARDWAAALVAPAEPA